MDLRVTEKEKKIVVLVDFILVTTCVQLHERVFSFFQADSGGICRMRGCIDDEALFWIIHFG